MRLVTNLLTRAIGLFGGLAGRLLIGVVVVGIAAVGGYRTGVKVTLSDWQAKELQAVAAARLKEQGWHRRQTEIQNALHAQNDAIANDLDTALQRLRDTRGERLPEASRTSGRCDGATGAQLSRVDGEFLARFAAARAKEAEALIACQEWAASVTVAP